MAYQRKPRQASKLSIAISAMLHGVVVAALLIFAAHEGVFGKRAVKIAVTILPLEQPPKVLTPPPPFKPVVKSLPEPVPSKEQHQTIVTQTPSQQNVLNPTAPPTGSKVSTATETLPAAPPAMAIPAFVFGDGATAETSSDPQVLYKGFLEYSLRSNWQRPTDLNDAKWVAEVKILVDQFGRITGGTLEKGSGNDVWDASVRAAVARTKFLERPPPKGFPNVVLVKFDVQTSSGVTTP